MCAKEVNQKGAHEMKTYKGIELDGLDKESTMAHSRFFEENQGMEEFEKLVSRPKAGLSAEQFKAISALNSVANANFQICNGGLYQLFENRFDKPRAPFNEEDVAHLGKSDQVAMLRELECFGREMFPERELDCERLDRIIADYDAAYYEEPSSDWGWDDDDDWCEEDDGLVAPWDFDERYYKVNSFIEMLVEIYAQYLNKRIEQEA